VNSNALAIVISCLSLAVCFANALFVFWTLRGLRGKSPRVDPPACWLLGHKWWIVTAQEQMEFRQDLGKIVKTRKVDCTQRPTCEWCGVENPGFGRG